MQTIRTASLVLEPLTVRHAHEMFSVLSDPAIYEFENAPPATEEALSRRYAILEARRSQDGAEIWLNWVIRLSGGELAGYVQATVLRSGAAYVGYELASRHWRQGVGSAAVAAMLTELRLRYSVNRYVAVLNARNYRSVALRRKLGFKPASTEHVPEFAAEADEIVMVKAAAAANVA
jgi:ribosomal-protein-alanine N-acetyltransferase